MDESPSLGAVLRELREAGGLSQLELAERSGLSPDTIRRLERGGQTARLTTLRRLALGLDMPVSELVMALEADSDTLHADIQWAMGLVATLPVPQPEPQWRIHHRLRRLCLALRLTAFDQQKEEPQLQVCPELPPRVVFEGRSLEYFRDGERWGFRVWLDPHGEVERLPGSELMPENHNLIVWVGETAREVIAEWLDPDEPITDPELQP